jgi:hypothetical protein
MQLTDHPHLRQLLLYVFEQVLASRLLPQIRTTLEALGAAWRANLVYQVR